MESVLGELGPLADPGYRDRLAKFGSHPAKALGVTMPQLRKLAKSLGRDQELALGLWESGVHEARILATLVAELGQMTVRSRMPGWGNWILGMFVIRPVRIYFAIALGLWAGVGLGWSGAGVCAASWVCDDSSAGDSR